MVGVGAGLELRIRNNFRARVDYGRALTSTNALTLTIGTF